MSDPRKAVAAAGCVVLIDQVSKSLAEVPAVSEAVPFVYPITNPGLTLGVVDVARWTEVVLMTVVILGGAFVMARMHRRGYRHEALNGLVIGGAVGNLLDRALLGSVRDFLSFGSVVVNVADLAVVFGVGALCLHAVTGAVRNRQSSTCSHPAESSA